MKKLKIKFDIDLGEAITVKTLRRAIKTIRKDNKQILKDQQKKYELFRDEDYDYNDKLITAMTTVIEYYGVIDE